MPRLAFPLLAIVSGLLLLVASVRQTRDYSPLYPPEVLRRAAQLYGPNLRGLWEQDLLGRLTAQERQAVRGVRLEVPLVGRHRHPFDYYAQPALGTVTLPIFSVKFLDDLAVAAAELDRRGCPITLVSDYAGVLRYSDPAAASSPLEALRLGQDLLEDPYVNDVSGKTLKSAIYFLLAHEVGHVLHQHRGYAEITFAEAQAQEIQADAFALNLMRRISVAPMGMVLFFQVASRFEPAPGDFRSLEEYEAHIRHRSTHPLTSRRLQTLATAIRQNADDFARGQAEPPVWRPRIRRMADEIGSIGNILDDPAMREFQKRRSTGMTFVELAEACC